MRKWRRQDYAGEPAETARKLIGAVLTHVSEEGCCRVSITETEAYGGWYEGAPDDAAHSYKGRTPRTEVIFGEPGRAYVYLIYGMYCCLNVVCGQAGEAGCVLIRAGEPVEGIELIQRRRGKARGMALTVGPGRLSMALGVNRSHYGEDLTGGSLYIESGNDVPEIEVSCRKHIDYARYGRDFPWRFTRKGSLWVTK